ncbi:Sec-independent protein translocase protein TatB [Thauera sp. 2A1]|uniref:Sec-independent protein translocase protein TatB n=1 Tax=Thauera sp. 2A1 TaxID=2570191 RepID=UPI00129154DA|nr:Sec-independent protein translocase protein TatB [Thauera sp. 2A1]KAI5914461.1 Sec-independent protein translocase protein TatB [Thauera sp. 2A1]
MFDFGFSELVVIGIVMLIVVGPERLPKVARTAGHLLGRLQRYVSDVKSDIQREMQLEELKKLQEQVRQQAQTIENSVRAQVASVEGEVSRAGEELRALEAAATGAATAPGAVPAEGAAAPASAQLELGLPSSQPSPSSNTPNQADKA